MDEGGLPFFDEKTRARVVSNLVLRAWLFSMLVFIAGLALAPYSPTEELTFITTCIVWFFIMLIPTAYEMRHARGEFGSTLSDIKLISKWLDEEKHWWGRPLFYRS